MDAVLSDDAHYHPCGRHDAPGAGEYLALHVAMPRTHAPRMMPTEPRRRGALLAVLCSAIVAAATGAAAQEAMSAERPPVRTPDVPFVPTRQGTVDAMLRLARVGPDDVVYDLGSGDGRIVIIAAQKYGARGVGVELVPSLVEMSRGLAREGAVDHRVTFVEGDLFTADISDATVVTLYLSPSTNRRLLRKLKSELRPGTRIVSRQFRFGTWVPDVTIRADDGTDLFLWTVPPR
jgi:SAM-dependent methyltransferase